MSPREKKAVHIFVPEAWHEWLREEAHQRRISIAELIREALEHTFDKLPKPDDEEDRKGGAVYPAGGMPAMCLRDG